MGLNVTALRSSFDLVIDRAPDLTVRFYEILFERYPEVKPLFGRNSGRAQADMLAGAIAAVIDHLEDAPWLVRTLRGLGAKHVNYGVTLDMYPWVGECLLAALAEAAGPHWTPELEQAWAEAYGAITALMLEGADTAVISSTRGAA